MNGTLRIINETALRDYALECSKRFRAGKFTRVGQDFIDEVIADVEAFLRAVGSKYTSGCHPPLYQQTGVVPDLITGNLMAKLESQINETVARVIQEKVQRQPSVGKTLSRTR